jgi:hypothetical protein
VKANQFKNINFCGLRVKVPKLKVNYTYSIFIGSKFERFFDSYWSDTMGLWMKKK